MTWQEHLLETARRAAADDGRVIELRVHGSTPDPAADPTAGQLDVWSDVDLAVLLDSAVDAAAWPALFGKPWALTRHQDGELYVQRVVYDDGRRLDLVSRPSRRLCQLVGCCTNVPRRFRIRRPPKTPAASAWTPHRPVR